MHEAATYPASKDEIFDWRTTARSLISFVAMTVVLVVQSASPQAAQDAQSGATITGTVTDLSGRPVAGVPVLLQHRDGQDSAQTKTDVAGGFSFSRIQQGTYYLTAERAPLRSDTVTAAVSSVADRRRVDLILRNPTSGNPTSGAVDSFAQAMEFADKPNFTVAGVTDWTAAGGAWIRCQPASQRGAHKGDGHAESRQQRSGCNSGNSSWTRRGGGRACFACCCHRSSREL